MIYLLIFIPIVAALLIMLGASARRTAILAAIVDLALALLALALFDRSGRYPFQYESSIPVLPDMETKFRGRPRRFEPLNGVARYHRHAGGGLVCGQRRTLGARFLCVAPLHCRRCHRRLFFSRSFLLLRVSRTRTDSDLPFDRHLGQRQSSGGRLEGDDLSGDRQLRSFVRSDLCSIKASPPGRALSIFGSCKRRHH